MAMRVTYHKAVEVDFFRQTSDGNLLRRSEIEEGLVDTHQYAWVREGMDFPTFLAEFYCKTIQDRHFQDDRSRWEMKDVHEFLESWICGRQQVTVTLADNVMCRDSFGKNSQGYRYFDDILNFKHENNEGRNLDWEITEWLWTGIDAFNRSYWLWEFLHDRVALPKGNYEVLDGRQTTIEKGSNDTWSTLPEELREKILLKNRIDVKIYTNVELHGMAEIWRDLNQKTTGHNHTEIVGSAAVASWGAEALTYWLMSEAEKIHDYCLATSLGGQGWQTDTFKGIYRRGDVEFFTLGSLWTIGGKLTVNKKTIKEFVCGDPDNTSQFNPKMQRQVEDVFKQFMGICDVIDFPSRNRILNLGSVRYNILILLSWMKRNDLKPGTNFYEEVGNWFRQLEETMRKGGPRASEPIWVSEDVGQENTWTKTCGGTDDPQLKIREDFLVTELEKSGFLKNNVIVDSIRRKTIGNFSTGSIRVAWENQGGTHSEPAGCCGKDGTGCPHGTTFDWSQTTTKSVHSDHIIPAAKGGLSIAMNCQILCSKCNLGANDKFEDKIITDEHGTVNHEETLRLRQERIVKHTY
jgi:hypothetical protein